MRVNRNHFGRQTESFEAEIDLPFLPVEDRSSMAKPFNGIFIRAPVVEKILPITRGEQVEEGAREDAVIAPALKGSHTDRPVEIMATLPGKSQRLIEAVSLAGLDKEVGDIIAVRQGNVFGTSFHPELTEDARIHTWWLDQVQQVVQNRDRDRTA